MADDFFVRFNKTVAPAGETAVTQPESPAAPVHRATVPGWLWALGGILALLILLYLFR
jgi:hypothetical protein